MYTLLLLALSALVLTACGGAAAPAAQPEPTTAPQLAACSDEEVEEFLDAVHDVSRRFDDALTVAESTPRINLPSQVSELQAIRRDTEDVEYPECANEAHRWLVSYMNDTINAFLAFQSEAPEYEVMAAKYTADAAFDRYQEALQLITEDADATLEPIPTPTFDPCHPEVAAADFEELFLLDARMNDAVNEDDTEKMRGVLRELQAGDWSSCFDSYVRGAVVFYSEVINVWTLLAKGDLDEAEERIPLLTEMEDNHNEKLEYFMQLYLES